jgi:tetratricopeptide (TPR) repeat protein
MDIKLKVLDYVRDGNQLINALEMRDFGLAEELVKKLRLSSSDFDYSKPLAAIETARTLSDMRLTAARAAAVKGDQPGVAAELKGAAEIWPTNPKLREVSNMIGQNSDVQAQALLDLDRLLSQRNFRQVFNDQGRFLASALNDPVRQEQLKQVLTDMNRVNMVVHAAGEAARNGNSFGAWEAIEREYEQFPEDPEITKMRSDLSVKASEFVSAIEKAKAHEQRKQSGSAIAWYLKARRLYPPSEFARNGIQRLVEGLKSGDGQEAGGSFEGNP